MRRPLCVFCAGMLGVALVCDFLPQTELFVPFAAFFVAVCLLLCIPDRTRKASLCLLLGAAAFLMTGVWALNTQRDLADKVVRLHVLANSDTEEDQALKLLVRDAVLERATGRR